MYGDINAKLGPARPETCREQSECEAAYQRLQKSQEELNEVVGLLHSRLNPVLGGASGNTETAPSSPAQSEVHGWLVAAEERTWALTQRIRAITASLTI